MTLVLRSRLVDSLPVSLAGVTPSHLAAMSVSDIEHLEAWQGNVQVPLAELMDVAGDPSDAVWQLEGDFSAVHHVGAGMEGGTIHVAGNIGRHAGSGMRRGRLTIEGNAGDWLGGEMRGGEIEVRGDVAHHAGGAYVGSKTGMRGGTIVVRGSAGTHAGGGMRRGWMVIEGDCGAWAGYRMRAGTLMVLGSCGPRPGAGMRRGTIALMGPAPELLPTFRYACHYQPSALSILLGDLAALEVRGAWELKREVGLFNGDLLEGGRGEVWLAGI